MADAYLAPAEVAAAQYPRYRWVNVGVWFMTNVSSFMAAITIGLLLPSISEDLGLSPGQQGVLTSAGFWGNLILAVPLGWWTSRYAPKMLTLVTLVLGTACLFLQVFVPVFIALLVGRLGFGIATIAREPARGPLFRSWFRQREIVLANSLGNVLFGTVLALGLVATPVILRVVDDQWRPVLGVYAFYFVGLTLLWAIVGRDSPLGRIEADSRDTALELGLLKRALGHRDLWVEAIGFFGATFAQGAFIGFLPTLMLREGISLEVTGGALALSMALGGVSGLGAGYLSVKRQQARSLLMVFGLLLPATFIVMSVSGSAAVLLLAAAANGIGWGFWPLLHTVPFQLPIRDREVGIAQSFTMAMISAGAVFGPLVAGFVEEATGDLQTTLFVVSFAPLTVAMSGVLLKVIRPTAAPASVAP